LSDFYRPDLETLSPSLRAEHQSVWLRSLVEHAYATAPAVRRKLQAAGIEPASVSSLADLTRIPITRKDDLIELQRAEPPFGGLLGVPPDKLRRAFQSPGPILNPQGSPCTCGRTSPRLVRIMGRVGDAVKV
jgi:phenylacetate-CoA ligase